MLSRQSLRCLRFASREPTSPCQARISLPRHSLSRAFHSSRPNHLLAEALQLSHAAFQEIHTLSGLPWCLSIPLTAALFRLTWVPIQVLLNPSRQRRRTAEYLLTGWRKAYQETARIKFSRGREQDAKQAEAWVSNQLRERLKAIRKHNNYLSPWAEWGLQISFLPIWILNVDVIRRMTGDERTLTSVFFRTDQGTVDTSIVPVEQGLHHESLWWIPDLMSPDQLWVLPLTFGALSFASAWVAVGRGLSQQQRRVTTMQPGSQRRISESFFLNLSHFVLAAPPVFTFLIIRGDVATAVVLYLIGSVGTQLLQRSLVSFLLGSSKGLAPLRPKLARPKGQSEDKH